MTPTITCCTRENRFSDPTHPRTGSPGVIHYRTIYRDLGNGKGKGRDSTSSNYYDSSSIATLQICHRIPDQRSDRFVRCLYEVAHWRAPDRVREAHGISPGHGQFLGIDIRWAILPPPPARPTQDRNHRRFDRSGSPAIWRPMDPLNATTSTPAQNAYLTYGAELARNSNAEYHITQRPGAASIENYDMRVAGIRCRRVYLTNESTRSKPPLWDTRSMCPTQSSSC